MEVSHKFCAMSIDNTLKRFVARCALGNWLCVAQGCVLRSLLLTRFNGWLQCVWSGRPFDVMSNVTDFPLLLLGSHAHTLHRVANIVNQLQFGYIFGGKKWSHFVTFNIHCDFDLHNCQQQSHSCLHSVAYDAVCFYCFRGIYSTNRRDVFIIYYTRLIILYCGMTMHVFVPHINATNYVLFNELSTFFV